MKSHESDRNDFLSQPLSRRNWVGRFLQVGVGVGVSLLPMGLRAVVGSGEGLFSLALRDRVACTGGRYVERVREESWLGKKTVVIVCDMWDLHHCFNAVKRVEEMAPRMNEVLKEARKRGAFIVHAPSSCMEFYEGHPARKRAQEAPQSANLPKQIHEWCHQIPSEEAVPYPIDQSDGGEDDDPVEHAAWAKKLEGMGRNPRAPWKRQYAGLEIDGCRDMISDSGVEIWNALEARGIDQVILLGVHTNMCVLGRPFGLRQMAQNGKNVVLMRDMTDTMYNPAMPPFVDHFRGTELIVEYIEKVVCPTVTSDQILGGNPFVFSSNPRFTP